MICFKKCVLFVMFLAIERGVTLNTTNHCPNVKNPINSVRKRRHVAFPDGSTISMTTSVVKTFLTHVPSGWYTVMEADLVFHLPDAKFVSAQTRKKLHHRQKREFWDIMQSALELAHATYPNDAHLAPCLQEALHQQKCPIVYFPRINSDFGTNRWAEYTHFRRNMNGQACIIRSICEAKTHLAPPGRSLVHDILRVIFTAPLHEQEFNKEVGLTYNELLDPNFCDRANDCPFSLLNLVLDLNKPPK